MQHATLQAANETIQALRARITQLEAMLDSIGAGCIGPLVRRPIDRQPEPVGYAYLCDLCLTPFDDECYCPSCGHNTSTKLPVWASSPYPAEQPLTDNPLVPAQQRPPSQPHLHLQPPHTAWLCPQTAGRRCRMSHYEKIDHLIVEEIKSGTSRFVAIFRGAVKAEAERLHHEDWQVHGCNAKRPFRFVESRLQALRKRGLIEHVKGWGWRAKEAA